MAKKPLPENLQGLHAQEELLRDKALELVEQDDKLLLHLETVQCAMDLADLLRQWPTDDEDMKVIQFLGMRTFNAFGASLKLAMSGYSQTSALIMRDILETVFLLDWFRSDRAMITRWRLADDKERQRTFSPVRVREALDKRDGVESKKRYEMYKMFSELAGHPTMKGVYMMRPQKDGDAVGGPFVGAAMLQAMLSEMGQLAVQVGEVLNAFFPGDYQHAVFSRSAFADAKKRWVRTFYSTEPGS